MTRTWQFDANVMPTDLVREQDFILRVRRLQRLGTPHLIVNLVLTAIGALAKNRLALEDVQKRLQEFGKVTNGTCLEMSNGDVFFIWEETGDASLLADRLVKALPIEPHEHAAGSDRFLLTYHMPADYTALRERANHYVEIVHAASGTPSDAAGDVLKSESARGPLTAWSVDQIGKLIDSIDIRTYARRQPIYRIDDTGTWHAVSEEYFISFDDLRRERFPKLDLITPEHLFFSLCEIMDQRLLTVLTEKPNALERPQHLNLSVASVIGSTFARFTHSVPRHKRELLTFEFHRGDLFQDFARTLSAIDLLHREGFKVAFDSITPDMLPYLNIGAFNIDYAKINVSGDRAGLLDNPALRKEFAKLPAAKLIFFRCDNQKALQAGSELGIKLFQGWHIDDLANPGHAKHQHRLDEQ